MAASKRTYQNRLKQAKSLKKWLQKMSEEDTLFENFISDLDALEHELIVRTKNVKK